MDRTFTAIGSISGFVAVAAGAFGAHALKTRLAPDVLAVYETAVRYHLVHALAVVAAGWASTRWPGAFVAAAGWLFVAGTVIFSGSLYALVLTGVRGLGAVTPLGGVALLAGWLSLGFAAVKGP